MVSPEEPTLDPMPLKTVSQRSSAGHLDVCGAKESSGRSMTGIGKFLLFKNSCTKNMKHTSNDMQASLTEPALMMDPFGSNWSIEQENEGEYETYTDAFGTEKRERVQAMPPPSMKRKSAGLGGNGGARRLELMDGAFSLPRKNAEAIEAPLFDDDERTVSQVSLRTASAARTAFEVDNLKTHTQDAPSHSQMVSRDDLYHGYNRLPTDRTPRNFEDTRRATQEWIVYGGEQHDAHGPVAFNPPEPTKTGAHDSSNFQTISRHHSIGHVAPNSGLRMASNASIAGRTAVRDLSSSTSVGTSRATVPLLPTRPPIASRDTNQGRYVGGGGVIRRTCR